MKLFDPTSPDIILISYPSGGFGHFLYYVLTNHAGDTVKLDNNIFVISDNGDCHNSKKYTNTYQDSNSYEPTIDDVDTKNKKILVLCDNGILNDSYERVNKVFPRAQIVRTVITDKVKPIIYQTCVAKAMLTDTVTETKAHRDANWSDAEEPYAIRENFTLLYHNWPFNAWAANNQCINVSLESLITDTFNTIKLLVTDLGMEIINDSILHTIIKNWRNKNNQYFKIYYTWKEIEQALTHYQNMDLSGITDLHDQGYINYRLEKIFNVTIPVYDYKDWFKDTNELITKINEIKYINN